MDVTAQERAARGMDLVVAAFALNAGLFILQMAALSFTGSYERVDLVFQLLYLATAGVLVAGLVFAASADVGRAWLHGAAGTLVFLELADLGGRFAGVSGHPAVTTATLALGVLGRAAMLAGLVQLGRARRAWMVPAALFCVVLYVLRTGLVVVRVLGLEVQAVSHAPPLLWAGTAMGFLGLLLLLVLGLGARAAVREGLLPPAVHPGVDADALHPVAAPPASATADFLVAGLFAFIGVVVTMASYSSASSGGRYVVTTGAFAVALVRLIRGLVKLARKTGA